jgi:hypothetical protein
MLLRISAQAKVLGKQDRWEASDNDKAWTFLTGLFGSLRSREHLTPLRWGPVTEQDAGKADRFSERNCCPVSERG